MFVRSPLSDPGCDFVLQETIEMNQPFGSLGQSLKSVPSGREGELVAEWEVNTINHDLHEHDPPLVHTLNRH